ncbi:hypothetical protein NP493_364g01046 [Ridgeia piscesae]|uniref:Uncharacterized protein n=1 Tax=Ridgeia piscesae TaxID=27915 RepID=A0AAD9L2R7_RIDPI|nr:hypothetical protein NP493_364g01046 [Ridgeia piscesae]
MYQATRMLQWIWQWVPRSLYRALSGPERERPSHVIDPIRKTAPDVEELLASYRVEGFPFENVAFEGGGIKGIGHTGAVRVGNICTIIWLLIK